MKKKAVVLDGYACAQKDLGWERLGELCELTVYDRTPASETVSRIGGAELALTNKTVINAEVMDSCPSLRYIGVLATGYNVVDIAAAKARGIIVTNIPAYSTDSVAQHTFALLLEGCSHVGEYSVSVNRGDWKRSEDFCYLLGPITELSGKTLGVVGYGSIGKKVAAIGAAFGMKVLAYNRTADKVVPTDSISYAPLDRLLAQSDYITLHCPATAENTGMINAEALAGMKSGAALINTARGQLVDEKAVAEALESGRLSFFAADVVSREPVSPENPLPDAKNCILTPHIAWATAEARARLMDIALSNVRAYLAGNPINVVSR